MTAEPLAFLALDLGGATSSAALIGRLVHRWRLIGSLSMPATGSVDALVVELIRRLAAADPGLATSIGLADDEGTIDAVRLAADLPRLVGRGAGAARVRRPPDRMADR